MIDLRHGTWQTALAGVQCDALIADPPYSDRVHASKPSRSDGTLADGLTPDYKPWTADDVHEFVGSWSPRVSGWMVCLCDHGLITAYEDAFAAVDRYAFPPLPVIIRGMSHRMLADGPSSENVWVMVSCGCDWSGVVMTARPRSRDFVDLKWNMRGFYKGPCGCQTRDHFDGNSVRPGAASDTPTGGGRGKPPWLEHALVRDYSRPGNVVCDPVAGWGGVLAAAESHGRRAIGSEMDLAAYTEAQRRLARPLQLDLLGGAA